MIPLSVGYELSIYDAYPWYFWFFLLLSVLCSTMVLLKIVISGETDKIWIAGFFSILIVIFIFILLPYFRGYCVIGGASADVFSHIGWIKDIAETSHISSNNFYPIIHIFLYYISNLLTVSVVNVTKIFPAILWSLYPLFVFIVARAISKNFSQALLITLFSFPLLFSVFYQTIHPSFLSFIFLPLLLYLYHKGSILEESAKTSILMVIFCFFLVFFHPETTLISIIIFATFVFSTFLFLAYPFIFAKRRTRVPEQGPSSISKGRAVTPILILTLSFLVWYTSQGAGIHAINAIYNSIVYGSEWSISTQYISMVETAKPTILQTFGLVVLRYGPIVFYGFMSFILFITLVKKMFSSRDVHKIEIFYGIQLISGLFAGGAMLVGNFIVSNPVRVARYFLFISTIFNGLVIYSFIEKIKCKKNKKSREILRIGKYRLQRPSLKIKNVYRLVYVFLFFCITICIFNVYPSPITFQPNNQFSYMNFAGSAWMIENRDELVQVSKDCGVNLERMEHFIKGVEEGNIINLHTKNLITPTHFGYDEYNNTLFEVFNLTSTYMVSTENGRQAYGAFPRNIQSRATQFNSHDYNKLNLDVSANVVYDNKELEVYCINAI